jgi:hypothetical protein
MKVDHRRICASRGRRIAFVNGDPNFESSVNARKKTKAVQAANVGSV